MTKYIFVTGGVISGLGKGITAASLGLLLKSHGYKVTAIKCDAYVNLDAGTMNPTEHGEVFVTEDGIETDQDLGHYERFLDENLTRHNYVTTGQVYQAVIKKERNLEYGGKCVEVVPHIPEEIIRRIKDAAEKTKADIVLTEIGGTVGEYQNILFLEANRMMKQRLNSDVLHVHVGYLPIPKSIGEMKSKPVQNSVRQLNSVGIQPDFVVGRSEESLDSKRKEKIAMFCNVKIEDVISNPDVESIYMVPLVLEEQQFCDNILKKFGLETRKQDLTEWKKLVETIKTVKEKVQIGVVGKYFATGNFTLEDSYVSVIEAIKHACWANNLKPDIRWIDSEQIEKEGTAKLKDVKAVIVPGGFGKRGVEGKMMAIKYCRENNLPYLGLCYGMHMAVVEFARNVCGMRNANSTEIDANTAYPVIDFMPEQKELIKKADYGGTMRLGSYDAILTPRSKVQQLYGKNKVSERHRHRYEVNPEYIKQLEEKGMVFSGKSPDGRLMEFLELPNHKFWIATQGHPEFKSRPLRPHPLFDGLVKAAKQHI